MNSYFTFSVLHRQNSARDILGMGKHGIPTCILLVERFTLAMLSLVGLDNPSPAALGGGRLGAGKTRGLGG